MSALGESFRSAREARGLTLSDVAEHIHIRSVYLGAIEDEDWSSIGAPVYVRGFIRTYARFLGLDAEDAVARFSDRAGVTSGASSAPPAAAASAPMPGRTPTGRTAERSGPSVWAVGGVFVALALVIFVGWQYYQYQSSAAGGVTAVAVTPAAAASPATGASAAPGAISTGETQPAPAPGGSEVPAISATASPMPAAKNSIAIRLTERSWLRVVVDGNVAMEGLFPAGTARSFSGKSASVRAGNAGGVDVRVGGKSVGPMGGSGDVVERSFSLQ